MRDDCLSRRSFLVLALGTALGRTARAGSPVRIGILHSQTGTMAVSERPMIDAARLAVEQIQQRGGLLVGRERRPLEAVVADGGSDPDLFAARARRLVRHEGVVSLFGCWTSQGRKAVLEVLEETQSLLWYPVQYEGLESSRHVIYTGPVANQQLFPALDFLLGTHRRRLYLLGSDYVFPRTAHKLARSYWGARGGQIVGEAYRPLGSQDFSPILEELGRSRPQAVLNTLNGDSNLAFFEQFAQAGFRAEQLPVMSVSIGEVEVAALKRRGQVPVGHYAAWDYFMSLEQASNRRFLRSYRARYGGDRVASAPVATAYAQVLAFARAVERACSLRPADIRQHARGLHYQSPAGLSRIDPRNLHTWNTMRIGQITADGQFSVVWSSDLPLRPEPYPRLEPA